MKLRIWVSGTPAQWNYRKIQVPELPLTGTPTQQECQRKLPEKIDGGNSSSRDYCSAEPLTHTESRTASTLQWQSANMCRPLVTADNPANMDVGMGMDVSRGESDNDVILTQGPGQPEVQNPAPFSYCTCSRNNCGMAKSLARRPSLLRQ